MVRDACLNGLLHSWSRSLDGDFLTLLSRLDVESSPEVRYAGIDVSEGFVNALCSVFHRLELP